MRAVVKRAAAATLAGGALLLAGCGTSQRIEVPGAEPDQAPSLMKAYGCGACHTIPGIRGADATVGPPLGGFGDRRTVGGVLPNTPENLVRWLRDPQAVSPGTLMPNLGLGEPQARDIAAYLYSH
jgi:cytochrome c1